MRPGLRTRITVVIMLISIATSAGMGYAAYRLQSSTIAGRFTTAATTDFTSDVAQAEAIWTTGDRGSVVEFMRGRRGIDWGLYDFANPAVPAPKPVDGNYPLTHLIAASGANSSVSAPLSRLTEVPATLVDGARYGAATHRVLEPEGKAPVLAFAALLKPDLVLIEFYDLAPMRQELATLQRSLTLIALAVATLGSIIALLAAGGILRQARRVAAAARRLGQGELDIRLPVRGRDELADLTRSFNTMAGKLGVSIEQQRRFITDVAHDLRTPVAAMIAVVDSLDDADPDIRSRSAQLLGTQSRRLAGLVEDLLEISRFDAGVADFRPEPVDLRALLLDAVEASGSSAEVMGDATVTADPRRLHTIARNLLVNAVRHGAQPVTVTIDATGPDWVTVRFADSGSGVPADLMPVVFDRFIRGGRSRTSSPNSGLGLAIARENVLVHGGRLDVHNDGGAVFTLSLPRASSGADIPRETSRP